jgi:DNA sulfur modification protein DndB
MTQFSKLTIPCLRGAVGDWIYYCSIIPFNELSRIDTQHKIKEDKDLDRWLQRALKDRVDDIKEYLIREDERFFNSIIVGVYGDIPDWYALDLSILSDRFKISIGNSVKESLGVLTLSGSEILFTIDGQHRVEAIKRAQGKNSQRFENDELPVIFVAHANDEKGFVRTRKLFATINREAQKPNENDLAIIDETFAYNIVARMIYARYSKFKNKIALTEDRSLDRNDHTHFTNLLSLVSINKILFRSTNYKDSKYTSPSFEIREQLYKLAEEFYNYITENINDYKSFFSGKRKLENFRNSEKLKPLNLLYLPIGLDLIAEIYVHFKRQDKLHQLKPLINKLNFDLYTGEFTNIFFNPVQNRVITAFKPFKKNLALYLLGEELKVSETELKKGLAKVLSINELSPEFKKLKLPKRIK